MTASPDPEALSEAAAELVRDGIPRRDAVSRLCDTFGVSQATAYRRMAEAEALEAGARGESIDAAHEAIAAMLSLLREAQDAGDGETAFKRAQLLALTLARLRIRHLNI
jgi:transposase-like protein